MNTEDLSILLVEDNPGDARLVQEMLAEGGVGNCRLKHVERLDAALSRLEREQFDVVLLDLTLPDASGLTTVQRVSSVAPELPIVVLSGTQGETLALEAVQAGAQDFLVKGLGGQEQLVRALRYAIERKRNAEHLLYLAQYDSLTGLPNRALLYDRLGTVLQRAERTGIRAAVLLVDLDNFKEINDTFGHDAGDRVLQGVARTLAECVRREDTVARLGGDEFVIILAELGHAEDAEKVARQVVDAVSIRYNVQQSERYVSASVGIAIVPDCGWEPGRLMKAADNALYSAKESGGRQICVYDEQVGGRVGWRRALVAGLREALECEEFVLHYQPQIEAATGNAKAVEALLRWRHREQGLLPPSEFFHGLEDSGLLSAVGEWVLGEVARQAAGWANHRGLSVRVAVNVAPAQLVQRDFARQVFDVLSSAKADPSHLQLEVAEAVLGADDDRAVEGLQRLREAGVRVVLDNFGSGACVLNALRRFPLDAMSLDVSLVRDVAKAEAGAGMVGALIQLGHALGIEVAAEGVEDEAQLRVLEELGIDIAQGYLLCPPVPADQCTKWLSDKDRAVVRGESFD